MGTALSRWHRLGGLAAFCLLAPSLVLAAPDDTDQLALTLRPGDTLIGISQRYLEQPARWPELKRLNRIANDRRLRPGSQLRIPVDWLRWSELPADVVYVNGLVTGNNGPLSVGMQLKAGDSFDTGTQGSLTLRFADGAVAVFAPATRAGLGVSRQALLGGVRATRIELQRGAVDTTVVPLQDPASRFDIRTPRVVTAVRGTRFRVAVQDEASRHEVLSGQVALTGASPQPQGVGPGEGVRAEGGVLGAVTRLLAPPDLAPLPRRMERTAQPLQLDPMAGAAGWRWQVAGDSGFGRLLQDVKTSTPDWVLAGLPDGDYHLRVRAADAQGLEGREAQLAFVLAAQPEPPLRISPPGGASVVAGATLAWAEVADAPAYHLQLARDAGFTDLVLERPGSASNRFVLEASLPPGPYRWRLATQRKDGTRGPFGDAGSFVVLEPSAVAPPQLGDGVVVLAWSGPSGFAHQIQVSSDASFSSTEFDQVVQGTSLGLPGLKPGAYQVRTRIVLPDGSNGPWSAVQRFEVPAPAPPPRPWYLLLLLLLPLL